MKPAEQPLFDLERVDLRPFFCRGEVRAIVEVEPGNHAVVDGYVCSHYDGGLCIQANHTTKCYPSDLVREVKLKKHAW